MNTKWNTVILDECIEAINKYNQGIYGKTGKKNTDIDSEACALFRNGLGQTVEVIQKQVRFIGNDYGGAAFRLAVTELPPKIANYIFSVRDEYVKAATETQPLVKEIPDRNCIEFLYKAFQFPVNNKKNWLVWGTKFWHFLNPNAFPINDRRARIFFDIKDNKNRIDEYCDFISRFREFIIAHQDWEPKLWEADGELAWSSIKLWDKVAYELGATNPKKC